MSTTPDFDKLGVFYLGRPYDLAAKTRKPGLLLYDSKDLVTHAVCVGMTGSGKTGLCLALMEEAALDGVPAILIDPKGDLGNLLLTFPNLAPEEFAPWINSDDARRRGVSDEEFAAQQSELWRKGLADWGQDGARIARLRAAVDMAIYTPGSSAGIPISIVTSFAAPPPAVRDDAELLRERVAAAATSLLGLLGIDADPIRSREHILLSTILDAAWREGRGLDLGTIIQQIQTPPIARVGVVDMETFFPSRERFALAMSLNNLLAAPGFSAWMEGEPLDAGRLLYTADGRPRLSIVSIAHLSDSERMFVVSMLLNAVAGWMRTQPGTTSLRAVLYMDEISGYFPPVANPPSKTPLLTLLKQARAYGLGVVLATQNPVDLDYKGLANAGTWLIGRLQTERDKARVLEGLEGAAAGAGKRFDRQAMEEVLAGLGNRVFLLNNVHDDAPEIFETRWAMSYLRGPLTRTQIRQLMAGRRADASPASAPAAPAPAAATPVAPAATAPAARPVLAPGVPEHFGPMRRQAPAGATLVYRPTLLGAASVRFADARRGIDVSRDVTVAAPISREAVVVDWDTAEEVALLPSDLDGAPVDGAIFADLPAAAARAKSYTTWQRDFAAWIVRSQKVELFRSAVLKEVSRPDESERDFRVRLGQSAREARDEATERLRAKYAPKIAALQERIRRAEQAVARESEQASQSQLQTAVSLGATLLGAVLGRRSVTTSTLGRATTAARGIGRSMKERKDVARATENVEALREQAAELDAKFRQEADAQSGAADLVGPLDTITVRPTRQGTSVRLLSLVWMPWWDVAGRPALPAWE